MFSLVRGGLVVFPNADAGAVASGHAPSHTLRLLCRISQICIVDRHSRTLLFAQCDVDAETRFVPNGMHTPVGAILLRHLLGVWYRSGETQIEQLAGSCLILSRC